MLKTSIRANIYISDSVDTTTVIIYYYYAITMKNNSIMLA